MTRAHLAQELLESYDEQLDLRRQLSVTRIAQEKVIQLNKQLLEEIEDWRVSREQWREEKKQLFLESKMESQDAVENQRKLQREIRRLRSEVEMWESSAQELREELVALKEASKLRVGQYPDSSYKLGESPRKRRLPHGDDR